MALETVTHIADLVAANPTSTDPKSQGDDHIRNLKTALKTDLPNITGPITATQIELNYLVGATTQPAMKDGSNLVTPSAGDNTTKIATTAFVVGAAFAAALPAQAGNAGKFVTTNGALASWAALLPPSIIRSARAANAILGVADNTTLIDITSGTFTQTFTTAATLGSGWYCYLRNAGTGDITLDPNAAETIDGLANYIMYPGETRLVQCDGAAFRTVVLTPFLKTFTASGTFTTPPGYQQFGGHLWAAGGSGRKDSAAATCSGGAGGACVIFSKRATALASTESVTIGAGGAAKTANLLDGDPGGMSTFLGTNTYGGAGGISGDSKGGSAFTSGLTTNTSSHVYAGAIASVPAIPTYLGGAASETSGTLTVSTVFGGGAGGARNAANALSQTGTTVHGGVGGAASLAGSGVDGTAPGGGGGSTQTGAQSGAGARGELRIWGIV